MLRPFQCMTDDGEILTVRAAYPADAAGFIETLDEVSKEGLYLLNDHSPRTVSEQERLIRFLDQEKNLVAVALLNNRIVGGMGIFAGGLSPRSQLFCNLGIHLISSARSKGIGTRMMAYGIAWAQSKNYHKICLSVFSTNTRAIHLYKKMGFIEEGRRRQQYYFNNQWVDEVLMSKFLRGDPYAGF